MRVQYPKLHNMAHTTSLGSSLYILLTVYRERKSLTTNSVIIQTFPVVCDTRDDRDTEKVTRTI